MKLKKLSLIASLGVLTLSIAACGGKSTSYNSTTPYGSLNLDSVVAQATDSTTNVTFTVTNKEYYNQLRTNAYDMVTTKLKEIVYKDELTVLKSIYENDNLNDYLANTDDSIENLIIPTKNDKKLFEFADDSLLFNKDLNSTYKDASNDGTVLKDIEVKNNYDYLRRNVVETVHQTISTKVLSSTSAKSVSEMEKDDIDTNIEKFITDQKASGYIFDLNDLKYDLSDSDRDVISFYGIHTEKFSKIVDDQLLYLAEALSSQNAVYQFADEEYYTEYDADEETKNTSYYLFKDEALENHYDSSIYTQGVYNLVYIAFNSRKEAIDTVEKLKDSGYDLGKIKTDYEEGLITEEEYNNRAYEAYLALYNAYYNYKPVTDFNGDEFIYSVDSDEDELSDINSEIKKLLTEDLESGSFLIEPRNLSSKYIMAYHISTEYDIHDEDGEQVDYDDLLKGNYTYNGTFIPEAESDDETSEAFKVKKEIDVKLKYIALVSGASAYTSINFKSILYKAYDSSTSDDDLYIYDPILEYKFKNTYSDEYDLISKKDYKSSEGKYIFKFGDEVYTVEEFYDDATQKYGVGIINNLLQYQYAYQYKDDYIDEDDREDYIDDLDDAISKFKKGKDSNYDKYMGVDNFLLLKYGYSTKDDVIKYAYDSSTALNRFLSENVYKGWVSQNEDGTYSVVEGLDTKTSGILYNLLTLGNSKYNELMTINLSHILINIDDDADGSPDDPAQFLKDMSETEITSFYNSVIDLARAIYREATYLYTTYSDNTYVEILKYIKTKYEQGDDLQSDGSNWDDYKTYNFLLTVENLNDIDESSVNNFVKPFKEYVKQLYQVVLNDSNIKKNYDDGEFIIYSDTISGIISADSDLYLTYNEGETETSLCATSFGYHIIILNSYDTQDYLTYKKDSVKTDVGEVSVLIYKDDDDKTNNINVIVEAYNEETDATSATWNQFFIYYCQNIMSESNSLSSDIYELMNDLFSSIISKYTSTDFQKYLLNKYINVTVLENANTDSAKLQTMVDGTQEKLGKSIYEYDTESDYYDWINDDTLDWLRPCQTKED